MLSPAVVIQRGRAEGLYKPRADKVISSDQHSPYSDNIRSDRTF